MSAQASEFAKKEGEEEDEAGSRASHVVAPWLFQFGIKVTADVRSQGGGNVAVGLCDAKKWNSFISSVDIYDLERRGASPKPGATCKGMRGREEVMDRWIFYLRYPRKNSRTRTCVLLSPRTLLFMVSGSSHPW